MVPDMLRFYNGYTLEGMLGMYARSFFALANSMYMQKADEDLRAISNMASAMSDEGREYTESLIKQRKGIRGILKEIRNIPR